ncbi:MAG TPA: alpha/beta hydrolase-fold protein [Allosphingosinicella sp.]|jgi:hypothetical protein
MSPLIAAALAAASPAAGAAALAPPVPAAEAAIALGTTFRLPSKILGAAREINVWLPPGYGRDDRRYDVLYLLDGGLDQDFGHIAGLAQLGALSATYDTLIVVGIKTENRRAELTAAPADPRYLQAFPESGKAELFRRHIAEEVIPFMEGRYRTGKRRALIGESLAGYFVIDTLLKRPELFSDYIAVSPSLWWDDRALARQSAALLRAHPPAGKRLYIAAGNEGGTMRKGVDALIASLRTTAPASFEWRFADKSASETHSTIFHIAALEALRWLYAAAPYDYGPTPWFMIEGAAPPPRKPEAPKR